MKKPHSYLLISSILAGLAFAAPAQAQQAPADTSAAPAANPALADIIVTARKRAEPLQKTPVAISVVSGRQLEAQHATSITDIAAELPNIQIFRQAATPDVASTYLRGFGAATNDPSVDLPVATYINGIYIPQSYGTLVDTFDIGSIELDRGPQDTLLGKNSPVGALVITTKKPTGVWGGDVQAEIGSYGAYTVRARGEAPIIAGVLAANISFVDEQGGNYTYNYFTNSRDFGGVDKQVIRAGLLYTPNDRFNWWLSGSVTLDNSPETASRDGSTTLAYPPFIPAAPLSCSVFGHCTPLPWGTTDSGNLQKNKSDQEFVSSQMSYRFDPMTVNLDVGAISYSGLSGSDIDGEPEDIIESSNTHNHWTSQSAELRFSSNKDGGLDMGGKLDWLFGAYVFHEKFLQNLNLNAFNTPVDTGQQGSNKSQAVFAHLVYHVTDALNGTFGIRQTWDQKAHSYYEAGSPLWYNDGQDSWKNTSIEAGLQYQIDTSKMAYFRFAQGYRGGGFVGVAAVAGQTETFVPETNNTYEVGLKTQWLDRRLRFNVDVFRGDYKNLQENVWIQNPAVATNLISLTKNVAAARVQGIEIETQAVPVENLTIGVNLGWLDTKYKNYLADIIGNGVVLDLSNLQSFGFSPKFTSDINASYKESLGDGGSLTFRADYNLRSSQFLDGISSPLSFQKGYGLLNGSIDWSDASKRYTVSIYGKNLLNTHYEIDTAPISLVTVLVDGTPTQWGVSVKAHF